MVRSFPLSRFQTHYKESLVWVCSLGWLAEGKTTSNLLVGWEFCLANKRKDIGLAKLAYT